MPDDRSYAWLDEHLFAGTPRRCEVCHAYETSPKGQAPCRGLPRPTVLTMGPEHGTGEDACGRGDEGLTGADWWRWWDTPLATRCTAPTPRSDGGAP